MQHILHQADMMATHIEFDQWNKNDEEVVNTKVPKTKVEQQKVDNLQLQDWITDGMPSVYRSSHILNRIP